MPPNRALARPMTPARLYDCKYGFNCEIPVSYLNEMTMKLILSFMKDKIEGHPWVTQDTQI
jgi:hypothetical protein